MFGQLKGKLASVEAKMRALLAVIEGQAKALEKDVLTMDAAALGVLGKVDATIKKVGTEGTQKLASTRARLKRLSPPA